MIRRKLKTPVRRLRTEPPAHSQQELLDLEQKVIRIVYKAGFVDHGRSDWRQTHEGGIETFSSRKRFVLPDTNLRITVGPRVTYVYRVIDGNPQIGESLVTAEIAKRSELLEYVVGLFRSGER